jgi:general secretion pathway protein G
MYFSVGAVVLMGLVAPRILGTQKKADVSSAKTQIGLLRSALERYALDMKDFPQTEQGLAALAKSPTDTEDTKWEGPYVSTSELPKDPWGHDYQYEYPPTHSEGDSPDIWSLGPDGEDSTDDDVVSWSKDVQQAAK